MFCMIIMAREGRIFPSTEGCISGWWKGWGWRGREGYFPLQKVVNEDDGRDEDGEGGKDISRRVAEISFTEAHIDLRSSHFYIRTP